MAVTWTCEKCGTFILNNLDMRPAGFEWVKVRGMSVLLCGDCREALTQKRQQLVKENEQAEEAWLKVPV